MTNSNFYGIIYTIKGGSTLKEKILVDVVEETLPDLDDLYEQYEMYTKLQSDIKKKKDEIKRQLERYFEFGARDNSGNTWVYAEKGSFKKEVRKKLVLNPTFADPILRRLMIFDKCVSYEPVYDLDVIQGYIADGTITDDLVNKMFNTEESYAIKAEKKKKEEVSE